MTKVEEIERRMQELTSEEWATLREWFAEQDAVRWDAQFEDDVRNGRLDALADQAIADAPPVDFESFDSSNGRGVLECV